MNPLSGFVTVLDGLQEIIAPINPLVSNLENHRSKEIAKGLLASGFSIEDIQQFADVSRTQLDPFLELEAEVQKRLAEATKTPVKEQTKAKA